ncbi:MAG: hypothetical protein A2Z04_01810 [Chloroflexi bacterium RBG_16_57_9]|nr:MAG: hypothetical protein A2Z04_01810 [Chloroflexi bacterium RBG_16_57_9]
MSSLERVTHEEADEPITEPFVNYMFSELIVWYIVLALLIVLVSLLPARLEAKADPLRTPPHVKPEWYFLFLYQALKLVPRTLGVVAPAVGVAVLFFLPFIDRNPSTEWRKRLIAITVGIVIIIVVLALTIWGQVS